MSKGILVDSVLSGIVDSSGNPLASGKLYSYEVGTTTPKSLYTDKGCTSASANPAILGANGTSQLYAFGNYKFIIKTSADVTVATYDNLEFNSYNLTWTPTVTAGGSMTVSSLSVLQAFYYLEGNKCTFSAVVSFTLGGTAHTDLYITFPVTASNTPTALNACNVDTGVGGQCFLSSGTVMTVRRYDGANWNLGASRSAYVNGTFLIA